MNELQTELDVHNNYFQNQNSKPQGFCLILITKITNLFSIIREHLKKVKKISFLKKKLLKCIPLINCIRTYKKEYIIYDIAGGFAEGIMHIPMSMSYAVLANMPLHMGLYVSFIYPFIYTLFGQVHQISVGVSAMEALIIKNATDIIIGVESAMQDKVEVALALSIRISVLYFLMWLLSFAEFVSCLLPDCVISGFTTGSAILIISSQLSHILRLYPPNSNFIYAVKFYILNITSSSWITFCFALASFIILLIFKTINNKYLKRFPIPGAALVMIASTFTAYKIHTVYNYTEIPIVGYIPTGLPSPNGVQINQSNFLSLITQAVPMSLIFIIIHLSIARIISTVNNYDINSNQELLALSVCNLVGGFFCCYPCATSLTRTSVLQSIGTKTVLHNIISISIVIMTCTFMSHLLFYLPFSCLGSIVIFSVISMLRLMEGWKLFKILSIDFILWLVSVFATALFGVMNGILISVIVSVLWLLYQQLRPSVVVLGNLPNSCVYRDLKRFPMAREIENIKILRIDSTLHFCNANYVMKKIRRLNIENNNVLVLDCSSVNNIDITALRILKQEALNLSKRNILLLFANWKGEMRDYLDRTKGSAFIPPVSCFLCLNDAVYYAKEFLAQKKTIEECDEVYEWDCLSASLPHLRRITEIRKDGSSRDVFSLIGN